MPVDPELLAILLEAGDDEAIERVVASMPPEDVQALLGELGTTVISHVVQMGPARTKATDRPTPADLAITPRDRNRIR